MTQLARLFGTTAVALAFAWPAAAQTAAPGAPQQKPAAATPSSGGDFLTQQKDGHHISSELVGLPVVHADGKKYGKISDLVLDDQGNLTGAVLSVGGFLSMGAKKVAVPWEEIKIEHGDNARAIIQLSEQELADAPEFKTAADLREEQEDRERKAQQRQNMQRTSAGGSGSLPSR